MAPQLFSLTTFIHTLIDAVDEARPVVQFTAPLHWPS